MHQIHKKHRLKRRIYGLSKIGEITVENSSYILLSKSLQKVLSSITFLKTKVKMIKSDGQGKFLAKTKTKFQNIYLQLFKANVFCKADSVL